MSETTTNVETTNGTGSPLKMTTLKLSKEGE